MFSNSSLDSVISTKGILIESPHLASHCLFLKPKASFRELSSFFNDTCNNLLSSISNTSCLTTLLVVVTNAAILYRLPFKINIGLFSSYSILKSDTVLLTP